jgi:predicted ArsR family transcriptional regulator
VDRRSIWLARCRDFGNDGVVKKSDGLAPPGGHPDDAGQATRTRVARDILEHGPSTAASIAERLSLTPAAVRRHLDALTAEGLLEAGEPYVRGRRGRGRPAKVYKVTDAGRDEFEQAYDDLAASALSYVAEIGGPDAVAEFARRRLLYLEEAYRLALSAVGPEKAPEALAELLTEEGYAASVEPSGQGGLQICQHHCPVAHVAAQFPQLCEAETEMIGRLLGSHVQRLATIAHGDGVCTTHVPARSPAHDAPLLMPTTPPLTPAGGH